MAVSLVPGPARVRVPATSANLGPGFDALGLALTLYDDVSAEITNAGYRVTVSGEGAGALPVGEDHLVVRAARATFGALGAEPPGLAVECVNRIPQARGLGSSSAAIVAGILLARHLVAGGPEAFDDAQVLRLAAEFEGHPDNVAPCLLGGLTIAWTEPGGARAVSLAPDPGVHPVLFVPDQRGLTAAARAALPDSVPHADAALTAGRAALLVHAMTTAPDLLLAATEDRLHQRYRADAAPETFALVEALRGAGVAAVVSGAGPSVMALTSTAEQPLEQFAPSSGWIVRRLAADLSGARVARGTLEHAERDPVAAGRKS